MKTPSRLLGTILLAAAGCGGPTADNSHIQTSDDQPISAPRFPPARGNKAADDTEAPPPTTPPKPVGGKSIKIGS